jgi:hypothetical protein
MNDSSDGGEETPGGEVIMMLEEEEDEIHGGYHNRPFEVFRMVEEGGCFRLDKEEHYRLTPEQWEHVRLHKWAHHCVVAPVRMSILTYYSN